VSFAARRLNWIHQNKNRILMILILKRYCFFLITLFLAACSSALYSESTALPYLTYANYPTIYLPVGDVNLTDVPATINEKNETVIVFPVSPVTEFNKYFRQRFAADRPDDASNMTISYQKLDTEIVEIKNESAPFMEKMFQPFAGVTRFSIEGVVEFNIEKCSDTLERLNQVYKFKKETQLSNYLSPYERDLELIKLIENTIKSFDPELTQSARKLAAQCKRGMY